MDPISIPPSNIGIFTVAGYDESGVNRAITGTVSVSDPTLAYCNKNAGGAFVLVPKTTPAAGQTAPVKVTVHAQSGPNTLWNLVIPFNLQGPPFIPATHLVIATGPWVRDTIGYDVPVDGGASVPI